MIITAICRGEKKVKTAAGRENFILLVCDRSFARQASHHFFGRKKGERVVFWVAEDRSIRKRALGFFPVVRLA